MSFLNSYDGFIFDYGGVLARHQTDEEQARMAGIARLDTDKFKELYWQDRADYDKGLVSSVEYWQSIAQAAGKVLSENQIASLVESDSVSWMNFDEPMWAYVDELRSSGKRVAILSNMPRDLGEALKARTSRFAKFHHITLSYEVKSVKPEAHIYESCLEGIGTKPKRTVFFDDRIANVNGAEMLGMDGVEFLDRDSVLETVRR